MSRILLVDDDKDMIKLTARWLQKAGYEVETALSGKDALESIARSRPDLILLDYVMPDMDGPATLEAIRENDAFCDIPVLFRTGKDDADSTEVMEKLHPTGVVSKAEGKPKLMKVVADVLSQ